MVGGRRPPGRRAEGPPSTHSRSTAGESLGFGPLKSVRSARTLALPRQLVEVLRRHRDRQDRERAAAGSWQDSRLVFASTAGGPIDHRNDTRAFKALLMQLTDIQEALEVKSRWHR